MVTTPIRNSSSSIPIRGLAAFTVALLAGLVSTGCSGDSRVAAVSGTVTLDGKPIGDAAVAFVPKDGGRPAFGITDADGNFELTTFAPRDGALIGSHSVTITPADDESEAASPDVSEAGDDSLNSVAAEFKPKRRPKRSRIPGRYSNQDSSGLEFEVKRGQGNLAEFAISSKP